MRTHRALPLKKICMGYYETLDQAWRLARRDEDGQWYFHNANDAGEGGEDLYDTLHAATAALAYYIPRRKYIPQLGWCLIEDDEQSLSVCSKNSPCTHCHEVKPEDCIMNPKYTP